MINAPGIYDDITADEYHTDTCPEPSLSSHVASILLDKSARHAWLAHPRMNKDYDPLESEQKRRLQLGSAAHALLIGRGKSIHVIAADNYQTKAAREARDDAILSGLIPCLAKDFTTASLMAETARLRLPDYGCGDAFTDGKGEVVIAWRDAQGPWCRGMIDWLTPGGVIYDYKTTDLSVFPDPGAIGKIVANARYETQCAFYRRGLEALQPSLAGRFRNRLIFQETEEPYEITVAELDGAALETGRRRASFAIAMWQQCLATDTWPGYPRGIVTIDYPSFALALQERREEMDQRYRSLPHDRASPVLARPREQVEGV